jgi:lipoate-protein ligase B
MMEICQSQRVADVIDTGICEYHKIYDLQRRLLDKRILGIIEDTLIITEHPPVFTIGRAGSKKNLLDRAENAGRYGIDVIEVDRGGDITFHGPGQLVLYPIMDLRNFKRDVHEYIRRLEDVIIDFLSTYGITSLAMNGASGVWIGEKTKIGSVGIGIRRWISYHGISINVNVPLRYFDMITPCGIKDCKMTSVSSILKREIDINEAKGRLIGSFEKIFKRWGR